MTAMRPSVDWWIDMAGGQRLVANGIAGDAMMFCDSKIGTFKYHISFRAHKAKFHNLG